MKKKQRIPRYVITVSAAFLIGICIGAGFLALGNHTRDYSAFLCVGCDASAYEQESRTGYLTIVYNKNETTVKVSDPKLQERLSQEDINKIIGVNLTFTLPAKIIKEHHLKAEDINPFEYLYHSAFEEYFVLEDVFF